MFTEGYKSWPLNPSCIISGAASSKRASRTTRRASSKGPEIEIDLPNIGTIAGIPKLFSVVTAKLREGVDPSEARTVMDLAQGVRKSLEVAELEQRLSALEEKVKSKNM
jgi:hypothetical protein